MTLYRDGQVLHQPTQAREVFDVSGAGDTVIANVGVMLAAGLEMGNAVQWSKQGGRHCRGQTWYCCGSTGRIVCLINQARMENRI